MTDFAQRCDFARPLGSGKPLKMFEPGIMPGEVAVQVGKTNEVYAVPQDRLADIKAAGFSGKLYYRLEDQPLNDVPDDKRDVYFAMVRGPVRKLYERYTHACWAFSVKPYQIWAMLTGEMAKVAMGLEAPPGKTIYLQADHEALRNGAAGTEKIRDAEDASNSESLDAAPQKAVDAPSIIHETPEFVVSSDGQGLLF